MRSRRAVAGMIAVATVAATAFFVVPASDPSPDGLEKVAGDHALTPRSGDRGSGGRPAYSIPGIEERRLEVPVATVIGAGICFLLACGAAWSVARRRSSHEGGGGS